MPDIENSRKTAEKGAEWVTIKQPVKQPKHPKKRSKQLFFGCFGCFISCFSAVLLCDPLGTLFGRFPAVLNVGHLAPV